LDIIHGAVQRARGNGEAKRSCLTAASRGLVMVPAGNCYIQEGRLLYSDRDTWTAKRLDKSKRTAGHLIGFHTEAACGRS
jgi:hypothetical protein